MGSDHRWAIERGAAVVAREDVRILRRPRAAGLHGASGRRNRRRRLWFETRSTRILLE